MHPIKKSSTSKSKSKEIQSLSLPKTKRKSIVLVKSRAKNQGGLEKAAIRIAQSFAERGHRVTWLTTEGKSTIPPPIEVHSMKTPFLPSFLRLEKFDRFVQSWLQSNTADIVFGFDRTRQQSHLRAGNGVHADFLESRIGTEGKLKYYSCLLNPLHRKILSLEKEAFESPSLRKIFTNSFMVKKQILNRFKVEEDKIQVIHNGVEWHELQNDFDEWIEKKPFHTRNLGLSQKHFHLLFIGHGYLRKGLNQLLLALAQLAPQEVHLSVIGHDKNIEMYKAKASSLGLSATFWGPRADITSFYQIADALVIPSFYDPFANVTGEALAMGLYVISSKQNGGHEILTSETGHVIEDLLSIDALVESLKKALQHPKTPFSALLQRKSVKHLDFSTQLNTLLEACDA